jgi:hypothetical protein
MGEGIKLFCAGFALFVCATLIRTETATNIHMPATAINNALRFIFAPPIYL